MGKRIYTQIYTDRKDWEDHGKLIVVSTRKIQRAIKIIEEGWPSFHKVRHAFAEYLIDGKVAIVNEHTSYNDPSRIKFHSETKIGLETLATITELPVKE